MVNPCALIFILFFSCIYRWNMLLKCGACRQFIPTRPDKNLAVSELIQVLRRPRLSMEAKRARISKLRTKQSDNAMDAAVQCWSQPINPPYGIFQETCTCCVDLSSIDMKTYEWPLLELDIPVPPSRPNKNKKRRRRHNWYGSKRRTRRQNTPATPVQSAHWAPTQVIHTPDNASLLDSAAYHPLIACVEDSIYVCATTNKPYKIVYWK